MKHIKSLFRTLWKVEKAILSGFVQTIALLWRVCLILAIGVTTLSVAIVILLILL